LVTVGYRLLAKHPASKTGKDTEASPEQTNRSPSKWEMSRLVYTTKFISSRFWCHTVHVLFHSKNKIVVLANNLLRNYPSNVNSKNAVQIQSNIIAYHYNNSIFSITMARTVLHYPSHAN